MKKLLLTFLVLTSGITSVFAQRLSKQERNFRSHSPWRYEVRIGYGGFPSLDRSNFLSSRWSWDSVPYYYGYDLESLYRPRTVNEYVTGVFSGEFSIHYQRWLTFAINLGVNGIWSKKNDPASGYYVARGASFNLIPIARFYYLNMPLVRLYSGGGFGVYAGFFEDNYEFFPAFQITPIGITVGRTIFSFAEISIGTASMGANFGLGYRF